MTTPKTTAATTNNINPAALAGWVMSKDPQTGRIFYANHISNKTQWDPPSDWVDVITPPPLPLPTDSAAAAGACTRGCSSPSSDNTEPSFSSPQGTADSAGSAEHHEGNCTIDCGGGGGGGGATPSSSTDKCASSSSPLGLSHLTLDDVAPKGKNNEPQEEKESGADLTVANNIPQIHLSPAALRAAEPFLSIIDSESRNCLGHRERIVGLDFSECGRYLATAAGDSTIRIWDVANNKNRLLATLTSHDVKYETTRVAWTSSKWGINNKAGYNDRRARDFNYLLATGGADGVVYLWGCVDPSDEESSSWTVYETLDHATYSHFQATAQNDKDDRPQVYSLQFIDHWKALPSSKSMTVGVDGDDDDAKSRSILMTSSDDHVHLWELDNSKSEVSKDGSAAKKNKLHLREVFSLRFGATHSYGNGVSVGQVTGKGLVVLPTTTKTTGASASNIGTSMNDRVFGGTDRNPQGLIFVFDACYCPANGLLGVALSDGTLRLIHGHGVCLSILQLPPGMDVHLTSFAWDSSGRHLATSTASGHVMTWSIEWQGAKLQTTCCAVLEGGHERGRPLFGVQYCGKDDRLLLSWGVDCRLCLWDAHSDVERVGAYLATLLDKNKTMVNGCKPCCDAKISKNDYPIYCVGLSPSISNHEDECILAVGGGSEGGFVGISGSGVAGIPVYLYNVQQ